MNAADLMFSLIRDVFSKQSDFSDDVAWEQLLPRLYRLSASHDMAHIVAEALDRRGLLIGETAAQFQKQRMLAVFRQRQIAYEAELLFGLLEEAEIDFMPLKGTVLRAQYPEAWMRTSCDIDVLVRDADLDAAISLLLQKAGYCFVERCAHDVAFLSPRNVRVELHFDLVGENRAKNAAQILRGVWEDAVPLEGSRFHYRMSDAMFYLYHVAHMAKHFEYGGCGVRPFVDLWLLDRDEACDVEARRALLKRGGLLRFSEKSSLLSRVWLEGMAGDDTTDRLSAYILRSGVFGNTENKVAMGQVQKGGRFRYVLGRIFPPFSAMRALYPVLKRHAWLLPLCYLRRWGRFLFCGKAKRSMNELRASSAVSADAAKDAASLLKNLEL